MESQENKILNNIKKYIVIFPENNLTHVSIINQDFEQLTKTINNKKFIDNVGNLLSNLNKLVGRESNITYKLIRTFLSCYAVYYFPNIVLNNSDIQNYSNQVILHAKKLLNCIESLIVIVNSNNISYIKKITNNVYTNYHQYSIIFDEWKKKDSRSLIDELIRMYYELDEAKHPNIEKYHEDDRSLVLENIQNEKNKITQRIKEIGGEEGYQYFLDIQNQYQEFQDNISNMYQQIDDTVRKAFWDSIADKINKDPPDFLVIIPLLEDVRKMLWLCVPNRHDIYLEILEHIDIELIKQMIEHDAMDNDYIFRLANYIIQYVEKFQSKSDDEDTKVWKNNLMDSFQNGMALHEFLPEFFKGVLTRLDKIILEKCEVEQMPIYDIIKERQQENQSKN